MYFMLASNEHGFAMLGDLKIVRPQPLLLEKQMYKLRTKVQRCLSSPNNCCHVAKDEDNNVPILPNRML